jgi:superfamily II DNA or RNA helicase
VLKIRTWLDSDIILDKTITPPEVIGLLEQALYIPNRAKDEAQRNGLWGWQNMPDWIAMFKYDGDLFFMPRGFKKQYEEGVRALGHEIEWMDRRVVMDRSYMPTPASNPEPWQEVAISMIAAYPEGIYKAPSGSGKTVTVLLAIAQLQQKALIIINTKDILWQWQDRVREHVHSELIVGQVGDGKYEISELITIATAQTINSRYEFLKERGFFDEFGFVCLDECHHATAETYNRIMNSFSSRWRMGVSATPDKTGDFELAKMVLGPITHETRPDQVTNLMRPKVVRTPTSFFFPFKGRKGRDRGNYHDMLHALITDPERNSQIVENIIANRGHHQLVVSKRLEHLDLIEQMLYDRGFSDPVVKITGRDDNDNRKAAKELAETAPCVLLSTLADEAMDIPRLDRLHLIFPQKNPGLVTQQVGRVERKHSDKRDAVIYDYTDLKVSPLAAQWRVRRLEVYNLRGYEVEMKPKEKV